MGDKIAGPVFRCDAIAPFCCNGCTCPCCVASLHVAEVVTDVPAVFWGNVQAFRSFNQWVWIWFRMGGGVTGNQATCFPKANLSNQWPCKAFNLVGNDSPSDMVLFELFQEFRDAFEQTGCRCTISDTGPVIGEEALSQVREKQMVPFNLEGGLDKSWCAGRSIYGDVSKWL